MARRRSHRDSLDIKESILAEFSARAKKTGIRAVKIASLAADLQISPTTFYKHFSSKEVLVRATVLRWVEELSASAAALPDDDQERSADEHMLLWAQAWGDSMSRYAPIFWRDLRDGYPEASAIFHRELRRRKLAGGRLLRPHIAPGLSPDLALEVLDLLIENAADPRLCRRSGVDHSDAIRMVIQIWRRGALAAD